MANFVITGATGHLGNVVVKMLLANNYKVKVLVLNGEDISPLEGLDIEIKYGDVRDKEFLKENITSTDIVIHMAGVIDVSSKKNDLLLDVNVNGTKNVADVCLEKGALMIYTSSVHTIPANENENTLLSEPTVFDENNIEGAYAKSKTIATRYVFEKCKEGLKAIVLYPSGIIGPYDYKISDMGQVILDHINGKLLAYVKGGYNFVDVRDVAQGILLAIQKGKFGQGYILSGEMCSVKKLLEFVNKRIGRKKLPPKLALWFAKGVSLLSEAYYKIRHKKPTFSAYSLKTLNVNCNFDNSKAKNKLGYTIRPLEKTIFDTVDWLIENKSNLIKQKKLINYNKSTN